MNKYIFIITKIDRSGPSNKVVVINHTSKFGAINILREMYPEEEYVITFRS